MQKPRATGLTTVCVLAGDSRKLRKRIVFFEAKRIWLAFLAFQTIRLYLNSQVWSRRLVNPTELMAHFLDLRVRLCQSCDYQENGEGNFFFKPAVACAKECAKSIYSKLLSGARQEFISTEPVLLVYDGRKDPSSLLNFAILTFDF